MTEISDMDEHNEMRKKAKEIVKSNKTGTTALKN